MPARHIDSTGVRNYSPITNYFICLAATKEKIVEKWAYLSAEKTGKVGSAAVSFLRTPKGDIPWLASWCDRCGNLY
jgi:hypothetical protein